MRNFSDLRKNGFFWYLVFQICEKKNGLFRMDYFGWIIFIQIICFLPLYVMALIPQCDTITDMIRQMGEAHHSRVLAKKDDWNIGDLSSNMESNGSHCILCVRSVVKTRAHVWLQLSFWLFQNMKKRNMAKEHQNDLKMQDEARH